MWVVFMSFILEINTHTRTHTRTYIHLYWYCTNAFVTKANGLHSAVRRTSPRYE